LATSCAKRLNYLKIDDFGRKTASLRLMSSLKIDDFRRKTASLRLISYMKIDDFRRKYAILRLTSYSKSDDFGRKYAILQPLLDVRPALRAGLSGGSSLGQRPATLLINPLIRKIVFVRPASVRTPFLYCDFAMF